MRTASIFTILAVALALCACNRNTTPVEKEIRVNVIEIGNSQSAFSRNYVGEISAGRHTAILSPHNGTVKTLYARVGQRVRQGAVLAIVDAPNINSLYKANQATLKQAQDGYKRAKMVYEGGGMSEIAWMDVQTKLAQAESAAEISEKSLEDCKIKAPFSGTISEVRVTAGDEVTIAQPIIRIIDESDLEVSIGIPENEYSSVKEGIEGEVLIPALEDLRIKAVVTNLGVNSTTLSHSYIARLSLKNYPPELKAGMACKVFLQCNEHERVIVPAAALKTDDHGRYLWLVRPDNTVEKRSVKTIGFAEKGVEISEGLEPGEKVIVAGSSKVSSGMKVIPQIVQAQ